MSVQLHARALPSFILAALLAALPARAGALEDLRSLLARSSGHESLRAAVELRTWNRSGDPKAPAVTQATAHAWVEHGPQGLRCLWSPEQIQQARQETKGKAGHSNPAREAMAALDAPRLADYFDSARTLLKELEHASLLEDRPDTLDGHAARLLVLRIDPDLGEEERKMIKSLEATARIWLDAQGVPVGAEERVKVKGRALLVISFQSETREEYRFARRGGRLVTLSHTRESSGSGGGESGQNRQVASLRFE